MNLAVKDSAILGEDVDAENGEEGGRESGRQVTDGVFKVRRVLFEVRPRESEVNSFTVWGVSYDVCADGVNVHKDFSQEDMS